MSAPSLTAPILKSLTEVQSERDNAPECKNCSDPLDEDRWTAGTCLDCELEQRKAYASEYGEVDPSEYSAGRGLPKF